jgi:tetratricopeptide (TPR) repeat protein
MKSSPIALPSSSAVFFSGYHPIEVTHEEFRQTVGNRSEDEEDEDYNEYDEGKSCMSPPKSMTKRLEKIMSLSMTQRKKKSNINNDQQYHNSPFNNNRNNCEASIVSGTSNQGQQSVANKTVDSQATLKVSNRVPEMNTTTETNYSSSNFKHSKTWKTIKRLVKGSSTQSSSSSSVLRKHATSYDGIHAIFGTTSRSSSSMILDSTYPIRKRIQSEEGVGRQNHHPYGTADGVKQRSHISFSGVSSAPRYHSNSRKVLDHAIQGRLDGLDILSLGPACRSSLPALSDTTKRNIAKKSNSSHVFPFINNKEPDHNTNSSTDGAFDPLRICFTDIHSRASPADLVADMIWMSAGKDQSEIVLEGFYLMDRWTVRISPEEQLSCNDSHLSHNNDSHCPPTLQSTTDDDESTALSSYTTEDGSTRLPSNILWHNLWGEQATPPPIPPHMKTTIAKEGGIVNTVDDDTDEEDEILQFAATCNVPIDLDEDAFIIDSPDHLQSVHELAMISLQSRHFESAISVFQKLLRGLQDSNKFEHLIGNTYHNIGMVQMCQGQYGHALASFRRAVRARKECLPTNHPDIGVSLHREGIALFAMSCFQEALTRLEAALDYFPDENAARAKVLNNIGVTQYHLEDHARSLKSLTSALEIQRPWLEGPVRRECLLYDASVSLMNMGKVYLRKGDYDLSYFVFEEACLMQTSTFRKDHDIVLTSLDNMARVHTKNGNHAESLRIFTSVSRSQESRFGVESEAYIETIGMKGITHFKLLEFEEALECLNKVFTWQNRKMSPSHPAIRNTRDMIKQVKRCIEGEEPMWV